jgi:hypothetical protein
VLRSVFVRYDPHRLRHYEVVIDRAKIRKWLLLSLVFGPCRSHQALSAVTRRLLVQAALR